MGDPSALLDRVCVRGFGYEVRHLADVPVTAFVDAAWPSPKYPFVGVETPVVALCGRQVRSVQDVVVVMDRLVDANCRDCLRMSARPST